MTMFQEDVHPRMCIRDVTERLEEYTHNWWECEYGSSSWLNAGEADVGGDRGEELGRNLLELEPDGS